MREDRQAVQTECLASVGWRIVAYGAADDRVTVRFQYGDKLISKDAEFVSVGAALIEPQRGVLYFFSLGYLKSHVYEELAPIHFAAIECHRKLHWCHSRDVCIVKSRQRQLQGADGAVHPSPGWSF